MIKPKINKRISRYNHTTYRNREIKYIVIHYVGAVSKAKDNANYFAGGNRRASAHYFTDDTQVWQAVEDKNAAWHCGGGLQGSGGHKFHDKCTNSNSIGIEMCCKRKNGKLYITDKTIARTAKLVKYLMDKYGVSASRVIRHYDVTGKNCPAPYLNQAKWDKLHETLAGKINIPKYPTQTLKRGDTGVQVKSLQKFLNKDMKVNLVVDGAFGDATERVLKDFQKKEGLVFDGICGEKTRSKIKSIV
ncbi:MAG: N-acetylmuramoyl-L-alanine amidase [Anaerovoracaceae bacterium]